jgi:hypothetical protein
MIAPQREQFLQRLALFSDLKASELRELISHAFSTPSLRGSCSRFHNYSVLQ